MDKVSFIFYFKTFYNISHKYANKRITYGQKTYPYMGNHGSRVSTLLLSGKRGESQKTYLMLIQEGKRDKIVKSIKEKKKGKIMRIISVIDLMDGLVVHGRKGEWKKYPPIKSVLCSSSNPTEVAFSFERLGLTELYIADLNAIAGRGSYLRSILDIKSNTNLSLMLDSGANSLEMAEKILDTGIDKVVISTETLKSLKDLGEIMENLDPHKIVGSIDFKKGKILSNSKEIRELDPINLALRIEGVGIEELIVVDVARVGSGRGVDEKMIQKIRERLNIQILTGGGIRNIEDIRTLKNLGVDGVLIATAFHHGTITKEDLQKFRETKQENSPAK